MIFVGLGLWHGGGLRSSLMFGALWFAAGMIPLTIIGLAGAAIIAAVKFKL